MAGVALGDIDVPYVWQAWQLVALTWFLCGRHGTFGTATPSHILSPTTLSHTHNFVTHTSLSRTTLSHTTLSHTNTQPTPKTLYTQHCHTHTTLSHTHNFVTHTELFHTNHSHTTLSRKTLLPTSLAHTTFHTIFVTYNSFTHTQHHTTSHNITQHHITSHNITQQHTTAHNTFTHTHTQHTLFHTQLCQTQIFHTICLPPFPFSFLPLPSHLHICFVSVGSNWKTLTCGCYPVLLTCFCQRSGFEYLYHIGLYSKFDFKEVPQMQKLNNGYGIFLCAWVLRDHICLRLSAVSNVEI